MLVKSLAVGEICNNSISSKVVFPIRSSAALSSLRPIGSVIIEVSPMPTGQPAMTGSYDYFLVVLSVVIAILASYTALDLAGRVTAASGWLRQSWLAGGAAAMGFGIWSMHYIGMLAFRMPMPVAYDWPTVMFSLGAAMVASALALHTVSRKAMGPLQAVLGSLMMGSGIASMHYIGMAAMRVPAECWYDVRLVALSILIAVLASFAALWLAFYFRGDTAGPDWRKLAGSVALGVAIPAMHYTGMAAAHFSPSMAQPDLSHAVNISTLGIAGIAAVTFVVLGLALLTSWVDRRFAAHALELQASSERYRLLFERNVAGIYRGTSEARILDCNDAFSRILGYASRKHLNQSACNILPGSADGETFLAALRSQKVLSSFEHCLRREDDAVVWVLENATLIDSSDEAPGMIEGTVIDITQRKQAETDLRRANSLLEKRSREIEEELILATKVQETLVPKGLVWGHGTVETHYQPARWIGGDFGLVTLGVDCLNVMVGDVSGHGIGSALVANRVYTEIIDLIQRGTEFAAMLQQLNRFVLQSFSGQFYFTLAAVRLNGDGRTLVFAGAGHPPAMIARPGEQPRLLESQSRALGLLEEAVNGDATTQIQLQAGDRVVIYTDGFSECLNPQEQELGIDGLSRIVGEASEQPLPEMKRAILDSIDAWQNGPPADDRALIVVGVR